MTPSDDADAPPLPRRRAERFVLELGASLHRYGTPAHRIEAVLQQVSSRLDIEAAFFAVPTAIFAAFGPLGEQRSGLIRLEPGEHDLGKLARLDDVVRDLLAGHITPEDARARVQAITDAPWRFPWVVLPSFCLASAAGAVFFDGSLVEIAVSATIGLLLGALLGAFGGGGRVVFVPVAAALGAVLATGGQAIVGPYRPDVVVLAGLLYLLPGLTLTVAMTELSTRHLVSGTARLTNAALVLLELGFGVALGGTVGSLVAPTGSPPMAPLPDWVDGIAVVTAALAFAGLFRARLADLPPILVASAIAYVTATAGVAAFGREIGALIGALSVGVACNAYARRHDRPATVPLVPAILLLVPGSLGLRSVTSLLAHDTVTAVDTLFDMTLVGVALAVGVLTANVALPPRRNV